MDLQLTDEQEELSRVIRSMLDREAGESGLVAPERSGQVWSRLHEFGALNVGSDDGALGAIELALIARQLGECLVEGSFVDTVALRYALGDSPLLGAGDAAYAVGVKEPGGPYAPAEPRTTLSDGVATGEKSSVLGAGRAEQLFVTARVEGAPALVAIAPSQPGVRIVEALSLDPSTHSANVVLEGCSISDDRLVAGPGSGELIARLSAIGAVLSAAESVGAAASVLSMARDYATERSQFGHAIGSFQALRHIMADMYVKVEGSWSSVLYGAASLDERADDALFVASIAKAYCGRALVEVAQDALQVFGGIAFTYEHPAHRFLRRIIALSDQYGSARDHEVILGRLLAAR